MGVGIKITIGAVVEVGLGLYYAAKAEAWKLGSTTNSVYAVASAASAGGFLLCLALMLWRKCQGQPVTDALATPVMLLAEGLYHNDRCLLDSAAVLLPIQSVAIAVLWLAVSAIGTTTVDTIVHATVLYYIWAIVCRAIILDGDRRHNSDAEHLQSWCLLPLTLLLLETVLAFPRDWKGGLFLLAVDGYVMFLTLNWLKVFALELILAPPTLLLAKTQTLEGVQWLSFFSWSVAFVFLLYYCHGPLNLYDVFAHNDAATNIGNLIGGFTFFNNVIVTVCFFGHAFRIALRQYF